MSRSHQALGVLVVALFGLWGCSRAPSADSGSAEKLKAVESKLARLEDDFRAAASARDQLTKKLIAAEEARAALLRDIKGKDDLLQARTSERDQVAGQFKALKDGLKELLAKAEGETKPEGSPGVPIIPASNPKPEK
jgi:septal ring factor EnvC (AmiA/AmiB activator)